MELLSPGHLIPLLIVAALVFFGWKQLPDMARSAGKSLRAFRTEVKGLSDDDATQATRGALDAAKADEPIVAPPAPPASAPAPASTPTAPASSPASSASPSAAADGSGPAAS